MPRPRLLPSRGCAILCVLALAATAGTGSAQGTPPRGNPSPPDSSSTTTEVPTEAAPEVDRSRPLVDLEKATPPPTNVAYLQYGVAVTAEAVTAAGPICDNVTSPCIFGPGGGIAIRAGWRGAGAVYLGGAYELSKQDPNKLYRLAILQQARFEGRYYFATARVVAPYATANVGVAGYGNEWSVDTWGPMGSLGGGIEIQLTRRTVMGVGLSYRLLHFSRFVDTSGAPRDSGISQLLGLDLVLEQRDPIVTTLPQ